LALANEKLKRLTAVDRTVELLALGAILIEPAGVVHDAGLASLRGRAGAHLAVHDLQAGSCGHGFPHRLGGACVEGPDTDEAQRDCEGKRRKDTQAPGSFHLFSSVVRSPTRSSDRPNRMRAHVFFLGLHTAICGYSGERGPELFDQRMAHISCRCFGRRSWPVCYWSSCSISAMAAAGAFTFPS